MKERTNERTNEQTKEQKKERKKERKKECNRQTEKSDPKTQLFQPRSPPEYSPTKQRRVRGSSRDNSPHKKSVKEFSWRKSRRSGRCFSRRFGANRPVVRGFFIGTASASSKSPRRQERASESRWLWILNDRLRRQTLPRSSSPPS